MEISRIEMVLLGIIVTKPSYAYEIEQYIEKNHLRRWVRIGSASVYLGLERLAKKGLARPREEREGKMPVRYRYSITPSGKRALAKATREIISSCEDHYLDLNLGFLCGHVLPRREIALLLAGRIEGLRRARQEIEAHRGHKPLRKRHLWQQEAILDLLASFCGAEERFLSRTVEKLNERQRTTA